MSKNDILVAGDIHAEWRYLNQLITKKRPKLILQTGDFGYWPNLHGKKMSSYDRHPFDQYGIKPGDSTIHWADGNHEDHWSLQKLDKEEGGVFMPGVIHQPRGSILTLPDGRNVMFFGGAYSVDKEYRTEGIDWFREETISYTDMMNLPDVKVDIVISHTCPEEFWWAAQMHLMFSTKHKDPSVQALSVILNKYRPKHWYFGHFHKYIFGRYKDTFFWGLSMPRLTNWWMRLQ